MAVDSKSDINVEKEKNSINTVTVITSSGTTEKEKIDNIPKATTSGTIKKQPILVTPKIGFCNKSQYDLHVVMKKEDLLIPPMGTTTKIYKESNLISIQGKSPQEAISLGLVSILR